MRLARTLTLAVAAACFGTMAHAQSADAVLARADKINKFMALLEHSDPSVRLAALEEGLRTDDKILLSRAIDAGLTSTDPELRNLAIIRHFSSGPIMMLEMPEGLSLSDSQRKWGVEQMPLALDIRSPKSWDPKAFDMGLSPRRLGWIGLNCTVAGGRLQCVSYGLSIIMEPSEGGLFTGTISTSEVKNMPFIYKYK